MKVRRLIAYILLSVLVLNLLYVVPVEAEVVTEETWTDPGYYTKGWYDQSTGCDLYANKGTQEDPYEIKSSSDFAAFSYYADTVKDAFKEKYIKVMVKELDLAEHFWHPIGVLNVFNGNFDGNGVYIRDLYVGSDANAETCGYAGLFGRVNGTITNVKIANMKIYSNSTYVGGLAAYREKGDITKCTVAGTIINIRNSSYIGGVAGYSVASDSVISECHAQVNIEGKNCKECYNGGVIGEINGGTVMDCSSICMIKSSSDYNGGFLGYGRDTKFERCQCDGGICDGWTYEGGFGAYVSTGEFIKCNVMGKVSGENKYDNCYRGGMLGYAEDQVSIKECEIEATIDGYWGYVTLGGLIGYASKVTVDQCTVKMDKFMNRYDYNPCTYGGLVGKVKNTATCTDCNVIGNCLIGRNSAVGGLLGRVEGTSIELNCYTAVNINTIGDYDNEMTAGGMVGTSPNNTSYNCIATGDINVGYSSYAGGFIGSFRVNNSYNCSAIGEIKVGDSSFAGGFLGYAYNSADANSNTISMEIQNCYSGGSVTGGKGSKIGAMLSTRQYTHTTINYKKCYWNQSANQTLYGVKRTDAEKVPVDDGITYTGFKTYQGDYMKSMNFGNILNENVDLYQDTVDTTLEKWTQDASLCGGFPVHAIFEDFIQETTVVMPSATPTTEAPTETAGEADSKSDSAGVFGIINFKSKEAKEDDPDNPEQIIDIDLNWGNLEYKYESGYWDEESEKYGEGTWTPSEEGTSDIIALTNSSSFGVNVNYVFTPNTENANYTDITGTFYHEAEELTDTLYVPSKDGFESVSLGIDGEPKQDTSVMNPEMIGRVSIFISKDGVTSTPDEPNTSEVPATTSVPVETATPTVTATTEVTAIPEESETPATV